MHVNDLPDDVLALLFQAALPAIKRQPADAKSGLGLLSVCRRWREVGLPMVYDTVVVNCDTEGTDGPETVDIKTSLDLVVDAKCLHMVRRVVIDIRHRTSPFQGLKAVIEMMRRAAGEWAGVRKLELSMHVRDYMVVGVNLPAADHEGKIASVSREFAALMPGLRELKFDDHRQALIAKVLFGQLAGFYVNQLQVLHLNNSFIVPQDRVFTRLRDVKITGSFFGSLEGHLPRLDPEVVESLVLEGLMANDMWSMFCADSDGCEITFPRLTNLNLAYRPRYTMSSEQLSDECPWALQFPAAKRVRISSYARACPSMENAGFPNRLVSLDITACPRMLPVFAGRKVHVSRNLALYATPEFEADNRRFVAANCILEAADSCLSRKLMIESIDAIPLELITYTGLTHLQLKGSTSADDMMDFIHRQRHLVSLHVDCLTPFDTQTDFSITECAEHEPMALLDTQIKRLNICQRVQEGPFEPAHSILKYLLLRIPTLKTVTAPAGLTEQLQAFIDEYVQWYPHLANVKLV